LYAKRELLIILAASLGLLAGLPGSAAMGDGLWQTAWVADGVCCGPCGNECVIGEQECGYCGLRAACDGKLVHLAGMPARRLPHLPALRAAQLATRRHVTRRSSNRDCAFSVAAQLATCAIME